MKSPINALAAVLAICFLVPQLAAPVPARAAELDPLKTREKPKIVQPKILSSERPRETPSLPGHPDVRREILPNGLTLITKVDRSAPVVSAQAWVKTGSILESSHMGAGLSHILEHMLFKGTAKRQGAQIAKEVEENGGYINAYTSWDRTVFHIDIPKDGGAPNTDRGTEESIDILLDAVMNATLPPDEYKLEQTVILREMAMNRDNPDRQASELLFSTAYATHPYRFPVIGYEDIYLQLNREEVFAYYKERYVPNNVIFIVAGDIDPDKVRSQVVELTKTWARKSIGPIYIPDEPLQVAPREVVEEMPQELSRIHLAYQTVDFRNPDSYALDILAIIAGQGNSSRLFQNLREKKDIVHEIDAWSHTPAFRGLFGVSATADPDKVEAARAAILRELDQFKTELVTRNELQKAIKQSLSSHLAAKKTMSGQASDLGSGELLAGDVFYGDHYLEEIKKVTPEDIRRVAKTYFVPSALTSVVLNPKGTTKRSQEAAAKQESRDIQKYVLKNGLTLLVKADNRLPFVDFRLVMKSGLLFENEKNNGISSLLAKALLKGTKRRSAEQIVSSLESVGGSITSFSGNNSLGVSIEVLKDDAPLATEILGDILKNSTFTADAVEREKKIQLAEIAHEKEQIVKTALNVTKRNLFKNHPYAMNGNGTEQTIRALDREDLIAYYNRLALAGNMVLAVFGDVDAAKIKSLVESELGSLPPGTIEVPRFKPEPLTDTVRQVQHEDKQQAVIVVAFPAVDLRSPERFPIEVMDGALSGMGSRLFLRLRDQLALCYYVGVNEFLGLDPGFIYFFIGTEPGKADQAEKEILNEIQKVRDQGVTEAELAKSKNVILGEKKMQQQNLGDFATQVALDELYGLGYNAHKETDVKYQAVSAAAVLETARKFLDPKKYVVTVVRPDAPAAPPSNPPQTK